MPSALPPLAIIAGPTASGKSAFALALAEATYGIVVNADSAQVYRDLSIVTARPSPADEARAEHRLYGTRDGADACSAADWAGDAKPVIAEAHAARRLPILVGGTGLYLRTLLEGIAPVPPIDPDIRARVRAAAVAENREALLREDPQAAAALGATDTARIARALEVVRSTGRSIHDWRIEREGGIAQSMRIEARILLPPRDWLNARCDSRFDAIIEPAGLAEVETLLARNLDPVLPVMTAIGVREIAGYVGGALSRDEAVHAGRRSTRRYAKRQYTWFRNQAPAPWVPVEEPLGDAGTLAQVAAMAEAASFSG